MSRHELSALIAFHLREGFTVERIELSVAQLTSVQINKASKKGAKKVKPKDLMAFADPWKQLEDEIDNPGEDVSTLRAEFAGMGIRVIRVDRVTRKPI